MIPSMKHCSSCIHERRPLFQDLWQTTLPLQDPQKTMLPGSMKDHFSVIHKRLLVHDLRRPLLKDLQIPHFHSSIHERPLFHDSWKPIPPWSTKDPSLRILKNHPSRIQETALVPGSRKHLSPRIWEGPLCQDAGRTTLPSFRKDHCQDAGSATLPGCRKDHSIRI